VGEREGEDEEGREEIQRMGEGGSYLLSTFNLVTPLSAAVYHYYRIVIFYYYYIIKHGPRISATEMNLVCFMAKEFTPSLEIAFHHSYNIT